jgi:diguanylate cyclase (GGDEF)-like protein
VRKAREHVWERLLASTVIGVAGSEFATYAILDWVFKIEPGGVYDGAMITKIATTCALGIPVVLIPLVGIVPAILRRRAEDERFLMEELALTDPLTGLLNRRGFDQQAEALAAKDERRSVSLLTLDVDHFKSVNDTYGHRFGDVALVRIADTLRKFRDEEGAIVARYGGEEFVCLLFGRDVEQTRALAERLRSEISDTPAVLGSERASLTVSIGAASAAGPRVDMAKLRDLSDRSLYEAKAAGRNRVAFQFA